MTVSNYIFCKVMLIIYYKPWYIFVYKSEIITGWNLFLLKMCSCYFQIIVFDCFSFFHDCTFLAILNVAKSVQKFHFDDAHFYQKIGLGGLRTRYKGNNYQKIYKKLILFLFCEKCTLGM